MKKLIITILALVYITTSTGFNIHKHYCMGKIADWGLFGNNNNTCSKCGMEEIEGEDNGCCKDKVMLVKNSADQKNAESPLPFMHLGAIETALSFIEIPPVNFSVIKDESPVNHVPHRGTIQPVYIRNCVFLI